MRDEQLCRYAPLFVYLVGRNASKVLNRQIDLQVCNLLVTSKNVNNSISGIGPVLHSAKIEPRMQLTIFQLLCARGGNISKIEKEKVSFLELYLLFAKTPENLTVKLYVS
jgi:hypothetical protein